VTGSLVIQCQRGSRAPSFDLHSFAEGDAKNVRRAIAQPGPSIKLAKGLIS